MNKSLTQVCNIYLVHLMQKLPSIVPHEDLLDRFPTSHMMCNCQLSKMNLCSLYISKSHKTSLQFVITNNKQLNTYNLADLKNNRGYAWMPKSNREKKSKLDHDIMPFFIFHKKRKQTYRRYYKSSDEIIFLQLHQWRDISASIKQLRYSRKRSSQVKKNDWMFCFAPETLTLMSSM